MLYEPFVEGEDCLNLNVWTPQPGATGLPVFVWIHGGGFTNGSSAAYDGEAFARDGVVCVSINYRLGVDGFLYTGKGPANLGMLDQVAALEWVQDNIAGFGGDPAKVTIGGESAGAMSVATLMAMPRASGLFHRAVAQSGAGHHALTAATATRVAGYLADKLGVDATHEALAEVPLDQLIAAQVALAGETQTDPDPKRWGEVLHNLMVFEPVIDGDIIPRLPIEDLRAGSSSHIDLLAGSNRDEFGLFLVPSGAWNFINDDMVAGAAAGYGLSPEALAVYRNNRPGEAPAAVMNAVGSDFFFRIPAIRAAESRFGAAAKTFLYEFMWRSPLFDGQLGACHAAEIPFVFDNLTAPASQMIVGSEAPQAVADAMHAGVGPIHHRWRPGLDPVHRRASGGHDLRRRQQRGGRPAGRRAPGVERPALVEDDVEAHRAVGPEDRQLLVGEAGRQAHPLHPVEEGVEDDVGFEPGQGLAEAHVGPLAKADVGGDLGAVETEHVRIGEDRLIPVGGGHPEHDPVAGLEGHPGHLDVSGALPGEHLDRTVEAQRFVDGLGQEGAVGPNRAVQIKADQAVEQVADEVGRRLVAGEEQVDGGDADLDIGQLVAVVVDVEGAGEKVVGRVDSLLPPSELVEDIVGEVRKALDEALAVLGAVEGRPGARDHLEGPALELQAVRLRDADQVDDYLVGSTGPVRSSTRSDRPWRPPRRCGRRPTG